MRIGGVSYFTPEEREQLKRDDRYIEDSCKSVRLEDKRRKSKTARRDGTSDRRQGKK